MLLKHPGLTANKDNIETYFKALGQLIKNYRKEKNLSLEELGLRIGLDRSSMHKVEKGRALNIITIVKLSLALEKEPKDFFEMPFSLKSEALGGLVKSKKTSKPKKITVKKKAKRIKK